MVSHRKMTVVAGYVSIAVVSMMIVWFVAGIGVGTAVADSDSNKSDYQSPSNSTTGPPQQNDSGTQTLIVRFEEARRTSGASAASASALKSHATQTQAEFKQYAGATPGIEVKREFWIANAIVVEVDTDRVSRKQLLEVDHVTRVHENFEVRATAASSGSGSNDWGKQSSTLEASTTTSTASDNTTYGVDMVNAPATWETFETRGEGVTVAVLDTGADPNHADIEVDRWAQFDSNGGEVQSTPYDDNGHGTHVAGTVVGGNASGTAIGVAPEANLYAIKVLDDDGGFGTGTFAQILAGMQRATEDDVDIISMSLSTAGTAEEYIAPVQNARDNGIVVIASTGNSGEGTFGTPASVVESVAVGAVDENQNSWDGSSGGTVETSEDWDNDQVPNDWPETYVVPDLAGPGVDVPSAKANAGATDLVEFNGTSMATPHVSGVAALVLASSDEPITNEQLIDLLETTATRPRQEPSKNQRIGHGIVDALNATARLHADTTLSGRVTDANGNPVANATVVTEFGAETQTAADGTYELTVPSREFNVTASVGYDPQIQTVNTSSTDQLEQDFQLDNRQFDVILDENARRYIDPSRSTMQVTVRVAETDTYSAELLTSSLYDGGNERLIVNGKELAFGEQYNIQADGITTLNITVVFDDQTFGIAQLNHTFTPNEGDPVSATTRGSFVHQDTVVVPDHVDLDAQQSDSLAAVNGVLRPGGTIALENGTYDETVSEDVVALPLEQPVTLRAADGAQPVIQISDETPPDSFTVGVGVESQRVDIRNVSVRADGANLGIGTDSRGSLAEIVDNEVRNATAGISVAGYGASITGNEVSNSEQGVATFTSTDNISGNNISANQYGVYVDGGVDEIRGNTISTTPDGTAGIYLYNGTFARYIERNHIKLGNNTSHGIFYSGVSSSGAGGSDRVASNTIEFTGTGGTAGIRADRSLVYVINSNIITGGGYERGIDVDNDFAGWLIANNRVHDANGAGIKYEAGGGTVGYYVFNNTVRNPGGSGVYVGNDSASPLIAVNTVSNGTSDGIVIIGSAGPTVRNNSVAHTTETGIYIESSDSVSVRNNSLTGGSLSLVDIQTGVGESNSISNSTDGVRTAGSRNVTLRETAVSNVTDAARIERQSSNVTLSGTTVESGGTTVTFGNVTNATVGLTYADGDTYQLNGANTTVQKGEAPSQVTDDNLTTIDAYLKTDAVGTDATLTAVFDYEPTDVEIINESTLAMYRLNESTWEQTDQTVVDTETGIVSGKTSSFGLLAPRGQAPIQQYTNEDGVVDTDGLRDGIDDWRSGEIDTALLRELIDYWRSGQPIE